MIRVEARLYATLRKYHPEGKAGEALIYELAKGTTLRKLLENELGVTSDEVKTDFVNGIWTPPLPAPRARAYLAASAQ